MRTIDLSEESQGSLCLVCDVLGVHETARLIDPDVGPVCYECFSELLSLRIFGVFDGSEAISQVNSGGNGDARRSLS